MSFKEKIDKLLAVNEMGINSVYALEKYVGASTGSISKYYSENKEPGLGTIKKIKKIFDLTDNQWREMDFTKAKVFEPAETYSGVDKLIRTLENALASKNDEINRLVEDKKWLYQHLDKLTIGLGAMKQAK